MLGIVLRRRAKSELRGRDLNPRPSGYGPDELPGCSTPRYTETMLVETIPERVAGVEPASSVWKTEIIAVIRYPRTISRTIIRDFQRIVNY